MPSVKSIGDVVNVKSEVAQTSIIMRKAIIAAEYRPVRVTFKNPNRTSTSFPSVRKILITAVNTTRKTTGLIAFTRYDGFIFAI